MLEAGYASVAEFHYLHHQPGGAPYADPAELAHRIAAAAADTGIGLTLLPVLYSYGGAGEAPARPAASAASATTSTASSRLREAAGPAPRRRRRARRRAALAPRHDARRSSPRSPPPCPTARCTSTPPSRCRRSRQVEAWLGARPVAFLLDHVGIGPRWCLIHATQMTADETARLAALRRGRRPLPDHRGRTSATASSPAPAYLAAGGTFGIGSDSNVRIALSEELRTLEYSQRLRAPRPQRPRRARRLGRRHPPRRRPRRRRPRPRAATAARSVPGALADLVAIDRNGDTLGAARRRPAPRRLDLRRRRPRGARGLVRRPPRRPRRPPRRPRRASPPATGGRCRTSWRGCESRAPSC